MVLLGRPVLLEILGQLTGPRRSKIADKGFRLVPTSMTLNDLERYNSPYAFFLT